MNNDSAKKKRDSTNLGPAIFILVLAFVLLLALLLVLPEREEVLFPLFGLLANFLIFLSSI